MKKIIILLILILLLFFVNCEYFTLKPYKEWLEENNGKDRIVYIAGYYNFGGGVEQACYWKIKDNEIELVYLPGVLNSRVYSIFVSDDNVYTCGLYNGNQACYWINDKFFDLESSLPTPSYAWSINVHNGIVYVAGYYNTGGPAQACYWANGKLCDIEKKGTSSEVRSIIFEDNRFNDIIMAGSYNSGNYYSCYWKNGQLFDLYAAANSRAYSIFVIGSIIYIAGFDGSNYGYWDNSNFIALKPVPGGSAQTSYSIYTYDNDIYVAGSANIGPHAVYWKNNQPVELEPGTSEARSICVYDSDVYTVGRLGAVACYWKNGDRVDLSNGGAFSIFIARSKYVTH